MNDQSKKIDSTVKFHLNEISFNDGTKLNINPNEILIVVGPTNQGNNS